MKEEDLGHGQHLVTGFDSLDEIFEYMARKEAEAAEFTTPEQEAIDWGGYVFRAVPAGPGEALAIWGHVWSLEEFKERETSAGATAAELRSEVERVVDSHLRGYRYGEYWSVVTADRPDIGSAHVSTLWPITRRDFEYAKRNGWRLGLEIQQRLRTEMRAAQARTEENTTKEEE